MWRWMQRAGGGPQAWGGAELGEELPRPTSPSTHCAHRARRCSSWSRAVSRCSHGLRSGAGVPCTRGCASAHTRCCRLTTCSTLSRPHQLQGQHTCAHAQLGVCSIECANTRLQIYIHAVEGGLEPKTHTCHTRTGKPHPCGPWPMNMASAR